MAKIIKLDSSRLPLRKPPVREGCCEHKEVVAYTVSRTVCCAICGARLDPFDVLVDLLKGYVPPNRSDREQLRFDLENERRRENPEEEE